MNCDKYIYQFAQSVITIIPIDNVFRSRFCNTPTVTVYVRRPDPNNPGKYIHDQIPYPNVKLFGMPLTKIQVEHGGPATGYLRITQ
jgi:hypothetical protein